MNHVLNWFFAFVGLTLQHNLLNRFFVFAYLDFFLALHFNRCETTTIDCCFNLISTNLIGDFMNDWLWCPNALVRVRCQI